MPRRERRKCSACQKTGHNARTCSVLAAQKKAQEKEQALMMDVVDTSVTETEEIVDATPTPARTPKSPHHVFVRMSDTEVQSPHIVNLAPDVDTDAVRNVAVFRESYSRLHRGESVDFASLIRDEKKRNSRRLSKAPAFQVSTPPTPQIYTPVVAASPAVVPAIQPTFAPTPKRSISWRERLRTVRMPRISVPRLRMPDFSLPQMSFTIGNIRPMAVGISLLAIMIAIPYPALGYISTVKRDSATIMAVSTEGFAALQASTLAAFASDMDGAASNLNTALGAFSTATNLLETEHGWLQSIASLLPVVGSQVSGGQHLLTAGHHMALGNTYLVKGIETVRAKEDGTIVSKLEIMKSHMKSAAVQYDAAMTAIASIPEGAIPKDYRSKAAEFELLFGTFVNDMYDVLDLIDVLLLVLGNNESKQYLVMFQNNHELRPTGGFMGSYALVHVENGAISWDIPPGGTYDVQGQLTLNYAPPLPLQVMNEKWELQDANWWSHVPASAAVIEEFYENSRPEDDLDGVFFVNATVLTDVLAAIGTIVDPVTGDTLSADSIIEFINERKAIDAEGTNQPKKVLSELVPTLLASLEAGGQDVMLRLLLTLTSSLNDRSVQLYANDDAVQTTLRDYGWTGEIREIESTQDYLQVVRTNLQGQKSDANIKESMTLDTEIHDTGSIVNTLTITRTHTGAMSGDLYDATNLSYIRAYVPKGSTLVSADGFTFPPESAFKAPSRFSLEHPLESRLATKAIIDRASGTYVYDEFNKTVFANWVMVPPGESRTIRVSYILPFTTEDLDDTAVGAYLPYTMMHQKQSGMNSDVVHTVRFPESWDIHWKSHEGIHTGGNFALYKSTYERDMYYGVILEEQ